jgi:hypothetical protein
MANRYAVASGNWSNTATWDGGTLPQAGDDVRANGFTVTINQDINVASIRTDASSPAVAGGGFIVGGNGRVLTCDVQTGTTTCLICSTNINWFLYGNIRAFAGSSISTPSVSFITTSGANLTMVGNVNGSSTNSAAKQGYAIQAAGGIIMTVNLTGNITGGTNGNCGGIVSNGGVINITGNITGGTSGTAYGVWNDGATCTINGTMIGGAAQAVYNNTGNLSGNCIAQGAATALNATGIFGNAGATTTIISDGIYTDCPPTSGKVRFKNINPTVTVLKANGTSKVLVEAGASGDFPIAADVRSGISYASGSLTGTLAVPLPANVRKGVPTDNTVGTADLTAADFWNTLTSTLTTAGSIGKLVSDNLDATISSRASQTSVDTANTNINNLPANVWDKATNTLTTSGSIGERLKTASTVQTTGDQLASYQV